MADQDDELSYDTGIDLTEVDFIADETDAEESVG